jgi:hypothetical protein
MHTFYSNFYALSTIFIRALPGKKTAGFIRRSGQAFSKGYGVITVSLWGFKP